MDEGAVPDHCIEDASGNADAGDATWLPGQALAIKPCGKPNCRNAAPANAAIPRTTHNNRDGHTAAGNFLPNFFLGAGPRAAAPLGRPVPVRPGRPMTIRCSRTMGILLRRPVPILPGRPMTEPLPRPTRSPPTAVNANAPDNAGSAPVAYASPDRCTDNDGSNTNDANAALPAGNVHCNNDSVDGQDERIARNL
jgi:hypothetical protein